MSESTTPDAVTDFLSNLSLEQLESLQTWLDHKAAERESARRAPGRLPPSAPTGNVADLAASLGLDISSLMREAKKRS